MSAPGDDERPADCRCFDSASGPGWFCDACQRRMVEQARAALVDERAAVVDELAAAREDRTRG